VHIRICVMHRCVREWMRVHTCVCSQYNSMDVQVQILCVHVYMRVRVPVRACVVHAHKNAIVNVKTFNCLYMNVCVHIRMCVRMCVCLYVHASCACSQKED